MENEPAAVNEAREARAIMRRMLRDDVPVGIAS